jgi:hypothetical protein
MGNTTAAEHEFAKVKELNKRGQQENLLEKMPGSPAPPSP